MQFYCLISYIIACLIIYFRMNMFYHGPNNEYIEAAYAPTDRATCRACKQKIQRESIKLGHIIQGESFNAKYWYHFRCFQLKPVFKNLNPQQEVYNLDQIDDNATDYGMVLDYLNEQVKRLNEGRKREKVKAVKPIEIITKQSKVEIGQDEEEVDQKKGKKKVKIDESIKQSNAQQNSVSIEGYTSSQQIQYAQYVQQYSALSIEKLKNILAANLQPKTGTKAELVQKCADGKVLGRIPSCPHCGGGKPRFDVISGSYKCPGYMDDTKYRHCNKTFKISEVKREKWTDP